MVWRIYQAVNTRILPEGETYSEYDSLRAHFRTFHSVRFPNTYKYVLGNLTLNMTKTRYNQFCRNLNFPPPPSQGSPYRTFTYTFGPGAPFCIRFYRNSFGIPKQRLQFIFYSIFYSKTKLVFESANVYNVFQNSVAKGEIFRWV